MSTSKCKWSNSVRRLNITDDSVKDDLSCFEVHQHKPSCWLLMREEQRYHRAGMYIQQAAVCLTLTFKASLSTKCSIETLFI